MSRFHKNRTIYSILIAICIIGFWVFENFYTPNTYSNKSEKNKESTIDANYLPSSTTGEVVHHSYYSLSYNESYEQAEWVAYVLDKRHLTYDDRTRPYFIEDPWVTTKSADWRNYRGSGYDRGHLCPAGDRRFSEQAYNETFYTSNISPQDSDFNAGIWNNLEIQVRQWAKKYGKLHVFVGGVLEPGLNEIGDEDVDVPNYFYKIISRVDKGELMSISFLIPNKEQNKSLQNFCVPIDRIEQATGVDFFQNLDDNIQKKMESSVDIKNWKF